MVHLFFAKEQKEPNEKSQELSKLLLLLEKYNLTAHDNEEERAKGLQAILNHLEAMTLTPTLHQWIQDDLVTHLSHYGIPSSNDFTNPGPS